MTTEEGDRLLKRLDEWIPAQNPGPLIRWAAAHLRACRATDDSLIGRLRERLADNHNTFGAESYRLDQIEAILDEEAG